MDGHGIHWIHGKFFKNKFSVESLAKNYVTAVQPGLYSIISFDVFYKEYFSVDSVDSVAISLIPFSLLMG
jgi:hypothetical protein